MFSTHFDVNMASKRVFILSDFVLHLGSAGGGVWVSGVLFCAPLTRGCDFWGSLIHLIISVTVSLDNLVALLEFPNDHSSRRLENMIILVTVSLDILGSLLGFQNYHSSHRLKNLS